MGKAVFDKIIVANFTKQKNDILPEKELRQRILATPNILNKKKTSLDTIL